MLRKRFIAIVYVFSLAILLLGGFSYFLLKNYTTRFHYFDSVNRLLHSYNFEIHNALLSKNPKEIQKLVNQILVSDASLQLVIIESEGQEYSSSNVARTDDPVDLVYLIPLDDVPPEDLQTYIIRQLGIAQHKYALFSKNYYLHEQLIGRAVFSLRASEQFNSYLKNIFLGFAFIFTFFVGLCLLLVAMVSRSLQGHQDMVKTIESIDLGAIGLTYDFKPTTDENKNITQIFGLLIEEIQRSYSELRDQNLRLVKSKEIFSTFLDSIEEGIVIRDKFRNIVYVNSSFLRLIGVSIDLVGKKLDSFLPPKVDGIDFNLDMEIVDDQSSLCKVIEFENRHFEVRKFCIPGEGNSYLVSTMVKELTGQIRATKEKAALQRQMFLSAKLASMGVFASGVAHEMCNPMTILQGNLELMQKEEEFSLTGNKRIEKIFSSLDRMKEFVDRLRSLERTGNKSEYKNVSLNAVITNVQQLLSSSLVTNNIELDLQLAYELPSFLGDASLVENALINLFINARDAFEKVSDEREKKITIKSALSPAGNLCLEFSDNACGIPEAIQDRLFDPLFTTSEVKHNGLGLTLVREIIHQHDGDIFFFSTENQGTTFKIFLPKHIDENSDTIRPRPRNIKNYSKDFTLFYIPQKSDFGEAMRDFLLTHYNVVICDDATKIDENALRGCNLALGEWPIEEDEGILLVDTIKKISPQIPLVVMGRNIGDEKLLKKIFHRGAQEVLSRDFSKLDIIHDIIRKHIGLS